tara:strand:+ start:3207 stop:3626 length:420 start_codon:yes stop_codon:yes gene_type:complete
MSLKAALRKTGLLHDAPPKGCSTQQTVPDPQQQGATATQHEPLKASKGAPFPCNKATQQGRNTHPKTMQQTGSEKGPFVAHVLRLPDGARKWWPIRLPDGARCRILTPGGSTKEQALDAARFRWPDADIDETWRNDDER